MYKFKSEIQLGRRMGEFSTEQIKNEPMFFNCEAEFAFNNGLSLTRDFLSKLNTDWIDNWHNLIIDTRVHMLKRNWFPAIPGYHSDDVPREREDGQPNYINPSYKSEHVMALVGGDICPTEFALGECELPEVQLGDKYYKVWHPLIIEKLKKGELLSYFAPSNRLIYFNWQNFHQGIRAVKDGWRWFIRASRKTNRKPTNEIRRQVQVYLENPMEGW